MRLQACCLWTCLTGAASLTILGLAECLLSWRRPASVFASLPFSAALVSTWMAQLLLVADMWRKPTLADTIYRERHSLLTRHLRVRNLTLWASQLFTATLLGASCCRLTGSESATQLFTADGPNDAFLVTLCAALLAATAHVARLVLANGRTVVTAALTTTAAGQYRVRPRLHALRCMSDRLGNAWRYNRGLALRLACANAALYACLACLVFRPGQHSALLAALSPRLAARQLLLCLHLLTSVSAASELARLWLGRPEAPLVLAASAELGSPEEVTGPAELATGAPAESGADPDRRARPPPLSALLAWSAFCRQLADPDCRRAVFALSPLAGRARVWEAAETEARGRLGRLLDDLRAVSRRLRTEGRLPGRVAMQRTLLPAHLRARLHVSDPLSPPSIPTGGKPQAQQQPQPPPPPAAGFAAWLREPLPHSDLLELLAPCQLHVLMVRALCTLIEASYTEDQYGVVQRDLAELLALLLRLAHALEAAVKAEGLDQLMALMTARGGGGGGATGAVGRQQLPLSQAYDTCLQLPGALRESCHWGLQAIAARFGGSLLQLELPPDARQALLVTFPLLGEAAAAQPLTL